MSACLTTNPMPARVWSRVGSQCVFAEPAIKTDDLMLRKGNVLQYKANASGLTKQQKYAKMARHQWTVRGVTWATQSQTYANPNTQSLMRTGATKRVYQFNPGQATTLPITCPYQPVLDPIIEVGGTLVCNTVVNPCTQQPIRVESLSDEPYLGPGLGTCVPTSASDVPGPVTLLCWNDATPTWYPRNRTTMNSAGGNKFPIGYKLLVAASTR